MSDPTNRRGAVTASATKTDMPLGADSPDPTRTPASPMKIPSGSGGTIVDPLLFIHYTTHGDLEKQRIASEHRLRILTTTEPDDDGVMRGFGLDESHPDVARLAGIVTALRALEHDAELGLRRAMRRCGLSPWVTAQIGLGDKQVARLLGAIGDPYWHLLEDRPRTVSELWAYSGLHVLPSGQSCLDTRGPLAAGGILPADHVLPSGHLLPDARTRSAAGAILPADQPESDPQRSTVGGNQTSDPRRIAFDTQRGDAGVAARRKKGQQANWSTEAKTRAYLCATSCIKQAESPYRAVYLARREHTATTHPEWTPGHSHNDGLRIASKAILRDLWREARRLHGVTDDLAMSA